MIRAYYGIDLDSFRYISHHGILGQKWGVRRYQNKDGSLTNDGKKRYLDGATDVSDAYSKKMKVRKEEMHKKYPDSPQTRKDPYDDLNESEKSAALKRNFNKMYNNCTTDEEKDRKVSAFERARNEDRWSIDFLEAIQNSAIAYRHDVKAELSEYAKYLDDPDDYIKNGRHKLREE